jgi:hypothetical protein
MRPPRTISVCSTASWVVATTSPEAVGGDRRGAAVIGDHARAEGPPIASLIAASAMPPDEVTPAVPTVTSPPFIASRSSAKVW